MSRKGGAVALIGGGMAFGAAAWFASRKSAATVEAVTDAVASGGAFKAHCTGYWPFTARADERKMEGGVNDRKGAPLHTLEDFRAGNAPFVSVSGDPAIFPYGQRLTLDAWPSVVFRVVDTGSHFMGAKKVYRVMGEEPLDVCVASAATPMVRTVNAKIIPGDNFERGKAVATAGMKGQTVMTGDDLDVILGLLRSIA